MTEIRDQLRTMNLQLSIHERRPSPRMMLLIEFTRTRKRVVLDPAPVADTETAGDGPVECHECGLTVHLFGQRVWFLTDRGETIFIGFGSRYGRNAAGARLNTTRGVSGQTALVLDSLRNDLIRVHSAAPHACIGRLNRVEYEISLRDLLALPRLDVASLLPEDAIKHGYSKVPSALDLSYVQIRKYLQAAKVALNQALVDQENPPKVVEFKIAASKTSSAHQKIASFNTAPLLDGKLAPRLTTKMNGNPIEDHGNSYRSAVFSGETDAVAIFSSGIGITTEDFRVNDSG